VLDALEGRAAALMSNHGTLTIGPDVEAAVEATLLLEWACGVYWRARALGEPRLLDDAAMGAVADTITRRGYGRLSK
jgi:L-fuculose-phosphate aldolase